MKLKIFTLLILTALIVTMTGTVLAQGPLPPADDASVPKSEFRATLGRASMENTELTNAAAKAVASATYSSITNGNFEQGRWAGWDESSLHNFPLVLNSANLPIPLHSGSWAAWLGGAPDEVSVISQYVPISSPASTLYLWYWIGSQDTCGKDKGSVIINLDITVYTWDLCAANNTNGWKNVGIDLSAYNGQTVWLRIAATTDYTTTNSNSNLFIDDVSLGGSFADVPTSQPYFEDIEILYRNGLTGGCSTNPMKFCPDQNMDRAQSGVFMLRASFGNSFIPGTATHIFADDWSKGTWAEPWAEAMYTNGLSAGCGGTPIRYCPWVQMPREQAVIFALRMKYGNTYIPPAATGQVFADMTDVNYFATQWAEQAYADGLIPACGTSGGKPMICPKSLVTRGLGAYMIVRAKSLSMP